MPEWNEIVKLKYVRCAAPHKKVRQINISFSFRSTTLSSMFLVLTGHLVLFQNEKVFIL